LLLLDGCAGFLKRTAKHGQLVVCPLLSLGVLLLLHACEVCFNNSLVIYFFAMWQAKIPSY
jgi:hypothetical protein